MTDSNPKSFDTRRFLTWIHPEILDRDRLLISAVIIHSPTCVNIPIAYVYQSYNTRACPPRICTYARYS